MKKVFLTGITGYIGLHCAAELIKKGYSVKGSVRSLAKKDEVLDALKGVVDVEGKLEFCELNLLEDKGWESAMEGCEFLMHVASPFYSRQPKDENVLIKPAVEGTQRALSAARHAGIKRVVLTSSMVAMLGDCSRSAVLNESTWTDVNAKRVTAYLKSKTLAEKSAWDYVNSVSGSEKMELVTVHPGPVYGPPLNGNLSGESMTMFKDLMTGKMPMVPKAGINMTDVRDVAEIHVKALENPKAAGHRFIVGTEKPYSFKELAEMLQSKGYDKVSSKEAPNFLIKFMANFSADMRGMLPFVANTFSADVSSTMEVFDWKPISLEKIIVDTAQSIDLVLKK